jgi:hypothetical protein
MYNNKYFDIVDTLEIHYQDFQNYMDSMWMNQGPSRFAAGPLLVHWSQCTGTAGAEAWH